MSCHHRARADTVHMARPAWSSIPAARSSLPVLRLRLWLVLGALLASAALGLFSAMAWILDDPAPVDFTQARPRAQGHAVAIAEAWLAGRATSLPVAQGIDPTFNESSGGGAYVTVLSITPVRWTRSNVVGIEVETHYLLVDGKEADFVAVLPFRFVAASANRGYPATPVLAAYPSLLPADPSTVTEALEYQNVELAADGGPPAEVQVRLEQWGQAYAANDGATMRDLADDTAARPESYQGLGGMALYGPPEVRATVSTNDGLVLRVRFGFIPAGAPSGFSMDLDMLVTAPDSTKPRIVAWGPPGSGPNLRPYGNRR